MTEKLLTGTLSLNTTTTTHPLLNSRKISKITPMEMVTTFELAQLCLKPLKNWTFLCCLPHEICEKLTIVIDMMIQIYFQVLVKVVCCYDSQTTHSQVGKLSFITINSKTLTSASRIFSNFMINIAQHAHVNLYIVFFLLLLFFYC